MTLTRAMGGEVPMPFDNADDMIEPAPKSRWPPQDKGKAMPAGGYLQVLKLDQEWIDQSFLADSHPEFYTVPADDTLIGQMVNLDFDGIVSL